MFAWPDSVRHAGCLLLLVTGGRDYADAWSECEALDIIFDLAELNGLALAIIEGGATGADHIACDWTMWRSWLGDTIPCHTEEAQWEAHGKKAGPLRNRLMIERYQPDACLAMPGGRGTADCVRQARENGVPVWDMADVIAAALSGRTQQHAK